MVVRSSLAKTARVIAVAVVLATTDIGTGVYSSAVRPLTLRFDIIQQLLHLLFVELVELGKVVRCQEGDYLLFSAWCAVERGKHLIHFLYLFSEWRQLSVGLKKLTELFSLLLNLRVLLLDLHALLLDLHALLLDLRLGLLLGLRVLLDLRLEVHSLSVQSLIQSLNFRCLVT